MYACVLFYFPLKAGIFPFNEDLIPNQQITEKKFTKMHFFDEIYNRVFFGMFRRGSKPVQYESDLSPDVRMSICLAEVCFRKKTGHTCMNNMLDILGLI